VNCDDFHFRELIVLALSLKNIEFFAGKWEEIMKEKGDQYAEKVDLFIPDPPYGITFTTWDNPLNKVKNSQICNFF
jgi:hypothetical protein